ncbi:MAG: translation initiation factor IF-2 [Bacteroidales bacterium]|nr:translation initiation factor IF-2 [Bacteroidales bacterium]
MSEEQKTVRLNKAAKEFNVGIQTIIEDLGKKGHKIDSNPNTRLTAEQYEIIASKYQADRAAKESADKIEIVGGESVVIDANKMAEEARKNNEDEQVVIRNVAPAKAKEAVSEPSPAPAPKPAEEPIAEPVAAPEPEVKKEPIVISSSVAGSKEGSQAFNAEVRIVDKIDLSSLNTKVRPDKKSAAEKKKAKAKEAAKPAEVKAAPVEAEKPVEAPAPVVEEAPAPVVEEAPAPAPAAEEKKIEFIETQYQKLEGPKTIGKIDLAQFDKPKTEGERHKRKRLKGQKVDEKAAAEKAAKDAARDNKGGSKPNPNSNQQRNKDKNKGKDKKAKGKDKPVEVDDAEIEKQIRDTLARLSPMGKSKTSKHNREKRQKVAMRAEEEMMQEMENQKMLQVTEFVTANELATMMNIPVTKIIATCMSVGIFVSINQRLDAEAIKLIADEFGYEINFVSTEVSEAINSIEEEDNPEDLVPRTPIVTVMGHVDHGKTSLLDYIRKTNVIAGEAGGITQHIGAYEVTTADGRKITFLDTPGHEAFTAMRARGAKVTDIAIIVIASDDKIMPQTIEAINHAQAAAVPMVFAINKIDKPGADPDRIKTELANMNLLVEEWGGKYQSQDISAKKGLNVDTLLEKVLLEAEMLELKGNPNKRAKGTVLECSLDKGRGYVAKLLVEDGTIRQGDPLVAGPISGRVKAMYNERNALVKEAGPSQPVLLLGLTGACQAGDTFNVTENEKEAKEIASKRQQLQREQGLRTTTRVNLEEIGRRRALGDFHEIKLIVKGDVDGSVEALSDSLIKLSTEEIQVNVIHKAVGQITEGDVLLAEASDAIIIGFQVRPSVQARKNAEEKKIDIRLYSIIYDAINELHDAMEGMLAPDTQEKIVANLEIRETFKISKVGTIAGCMCLDGKIQRSHNVRIIRDGIVVFTGKLASLKRFKDDVKEVVAGQDCGLNIENFNDIKVGDIVEAYEIIEIKRTLK